MAIWFSISSIGSNVGLSLITSIFDPFSLGDPPVLLADLVMVRDFTGDNDDLFIFRGGEKGTDFLGLGFLGEDPSAVSLLLRR